MITKLLLLTILLSCSTLKQEPKSQSYFNRISKLILADREIIPDLTKLAEEAANRIIRGGQLWAAGEKSIVSEISWRSGNPMMIRWLDDSKLTERDVVLYFESDITDMNWIIDSAKLSSTKAMVIRFGRAAIENKASKYKIPNTIGNALLGFMFTGELIAAFTRQGKMPVLFETIGRYEGHPRITKYKAGEIPFHDKTNVPPIGRGILAHQYLDEIQKILKRLQDEELKKITKAGELMAQTRREGKTSFLYLMGHMGPKHALASHLTANYKVKIWDSGFTSNTHSKESFTSRDIVVYIGSHYPPEDLLESASQSKTQVIYVSVHQDRNTKNSSSVIWIDPMWPWFESAVKIPNYDVPALAVSGVINAVILWELDRLSNQ